MQITVAQPSTRTGTRHRCMSLVPVLSRGRFGPTRPQAARAAEALTRIVDRDLELVRAMPAHRRHRQTDRLAAIVLLAQAYRHFANGWIGRRELRRRLRARTDELIKAIPDEPAVARTTIERVEVIRFAKRPLG